MNTLTSHLNGGRVVLANVNPEVAQCHHGGQAIFPGEKSRDVAVARGNCTEHQGTVGYGLVTRHLDHTFDAARRLDVELLRDVLRHGPTPRSRS